VSLPDLARAASHILAFLEAHRRPACVIGGLAVSRWGEPRATQDVDLTVLCEFGDEKNVLQELLSEYSSVVADPQRFADLNHLAILSLPGGIKADVSFAGFPFEREVIERSTNWELAERTSIRTCSAEDLVIYKLVAARPGDIQDVIRIVQRQGRRLDVDRIRYWGRQFADLKEDPDLLRPFEDALKKASQTD